MRTFFTGDRHAEDKVLQPGDPLYDRIQRIRDHLSETGPAEHVPVGDWRDMLESYKPTDPLTWPRTPGAAYAFYPMDQSGSMPPSSVATHAEKIAEFARTYLGPDSALWPEAMLQHAWECASPETQEECRRAAVTIIEGSFTFVGEADA